MKSLVFLGSLTFAGLACAQSSVSLYGLVDAGFTYTSNQGGKSTFEAADGVNFGNRIGLKGSEDLGGGLKSIFTLEHGFSLNTGEVAKYQPMWGRQAFVGLETPQGTVTLGRQYDFVFEYLGFLNIGGFASVYAGHHGDFDRISGWRVNRSIKYKSPSFGGFSFGGLYAPSSDEVGKTLSLGAGYQAEGWSLAASYVKVKDTTVNPDFQLGVSTFLGQTLTWDGTPVSLDSQEVVGAGGTKQIGAFTLVGNATQTTFKGHGGKTRQKVFEVGGMYPLADKMLGIVGFQHSKLEKDKWNQLTVGVRYDLSKRTWLYGSASWTKASEGVLVNQGAGYYLDNADTNRQDTFRLAMVHTF